jgi:hypothetical protein
MSQAARNAATAAKHKEQIAKVISGKAKNSGLMRDEFKRDSVLGAEILGDLLPLHKLAFADPVTPADDIGIAGHLKWLPLSCLRIDPRYQRPILANGRKTIRAIIEGFRWSKFSPLVVGERDGGLYAIIDGQHRATGALTHGGIREVPCLVIRGGAEAEAGAFAIINGQVTNISGTQIHVARVMAGEKDAIALDTICQAAGVRIMKFPAAFGTWKPGETMASGTLRICHKRYGRETLITALQCITQTNDGNAGYVKADVIHGFCEALSRNTTWRDAGDTLFQSIETVGVPGIYRTSKALKDGAGKGASMWVLVAKVTSELLARTMPVALVKKRG